MMHNHTKDELLCIFFFLQGKTRSPDRLVQLVQTQEFTIMQKKLKRKENKTH